MSGINSMVVPVVRSMTTTYDSQHLQDTNNKTVFWKENPLPIFNLTAPNIPFTNLHLWPSNPQLMVASHQKQYCYSLNEKWPKISQTMRKLTAWFI